MVAVIKTSHSIQRILNYNEFKVKEGKANCINAVNFPLDLEKLNFNLKLNRFLKQASLNENAKRNTVHVSLNFDPSENHSKEKLNQIANVYMDKIGFGKQPYLVYQHFDAGHPHIHIVTNNIQRDGKRIDLHLLGIKKSEPARKEIETIFGLVKAEGLKVKEKSLRPIATKKIEYGKAESKKAISEVLNKVLFEYKYSSLPELNAVLNLYNIHADRGTEESRIFKNNGLLYKILDENSKPIGVPIKASDFNFKPTLIFLAEKFKNNQTKKTSDKLRVKNCIDLVLLKDQVISVTNFAKLTQKEGIQTVFRRTNDGLLYGITFVDHTTKNVFNGSSLGKGYSAKAIEERCGVKVTKKEQKNQTHEKILSKDFLIDSLQYQKHTLTIPNLVKILDMLNHIEYTSDYLPNEWKKERNKRKTRRI